MKRKEKTTLWISKKIKKALDEQKKAGETYEDVIKRFLSGEVEIYVEILSVDGDLPFKHEVIFRLGNFYYAYKNGDFHQLESWKMATTPKKVEKVFPK